MTDLVPTAEIVRIVGVPRHRTAHFGRLVSAEGTIYILHSHDCRNSGIDLRDCRFSVALDHDDQAWPPDTAVELDIIADRIALQTTLDFGTGA